MSPRGVVLFTDKGDLAADLLILELGRLGVQHSRVNLEEFPETTRMAWTIDETRLFDPFEANGLEWDSIGSAWFRRLPRRSGRAAEQTREIDEFVSRESRQFLLGVLLDSDWLWVNHPSSVARSENKLVQLRSARRVGFAIPATLVSNDVDSIRRFAAGRKEVIAKALVGGVVRVGEADCAIFTTRLGPRDLEEDAALSAAPSIYQELVRPALDLRVTVVGRNVFAASIEPVGATTSAVDWREHPSSCLRYARYDLPNAVESRCVQLVETMGLSYAALDLLITPRREVIFLELNPSGQWGWLEQSIDVPITRSIARMLAEGRPDA
jgi:glutathione synthase/RimK-type ligase-like ATP-grasp enzyme